MTAFRMAVTKHIRAINWRAASLLLVMALWWMTPAITLALPERVECGMECCVSIGYCCCATRFEQSGDDHEPHRETVVTRVEITQSCPSNCATLTASP